MTNALEIKRATKYWRSGQAPDIKPRYWENSARQVITIERIENLAEKAKKLLKRLGF